MTDRAIVLLSGGIDSATTLAIAREQGYECFVLSMDYGQRHAVELEAAARIAKVLHAAEHKVLSIDLTTFGGSALTDNTIAVPDTASTGIPITYVPARNTIFLSFALAYAEVRQCGHIFIGVNAVDYSGYPDCRPQYIAAYQAMAGLATRAGIEGAPLTIHTPLIESSKAAIIREGHRLGVDFALTVSCYQADGQGRACGSCDSCRIRREGFVAAGVPDPTRYFN